MVSLTAATGLIAISYGPSRPPDEPPNRIPRAAPYVTAETQNVSPPFERYWKENHNPGKCSTCHSRIFSEWNGSMMSNSWRDPGWRGAFLLVARQTSTAGNCDLPDPPDGTERARLNPFANGDCSATFDIGTAQHETSRSGSLLDGFCSQCHMPTNFVDNVASGGVATDQISGLEHGHLDPNFNPTSDNGTGLAFATLDSQIRNTETGKRGIFCAVCHTYADTREMPFGNYRKSDHPYQPVDGRDRVQPPAPQARNLGFAIGAGSYRLSPQAIGGSLFLGPLSAAPRAQQADPYLSKVFGEQLLYQQGAFNGHKGAYQGLHERAEFCSACHDVTNPLSIKNRLGKWVGGFPIERTYTEWSGSRYADRPGNKNFDPRFKRDCQTCHMQQDFGAPGTAQTLYHNGQPLPVLQGSPKNDGPVRPYFSHHFIGGNTYVDRMIGADVDEFGSPESYPQLSTFSFSSADPKSPYNNAYWTNVSNRGAMTQHSRLAWDRLRNVLDLGLQGPAVIAAGDRAPLRIVVTNSGSGHDFPSGFPEGRNAWVSVRAFDLATGAELAIYDSYWKRTSRGVGYLTRTDQKDPKYPRCAEELPAGSPDPYAVQFKAVASLGDGCPTLELAYASPLNLVTNSDGLPIDERGKVIDRQNPRGLPQYRDLDGDGDLFDDAYLSDTRLRPLPHPGATATLDRYSVVIPPGTLGPVAVTAAVYYQSFEAIVARKFLGNLADLNTDSILETCVLGGACDGRTPTVEPAVVEGAPPVPMEVRNWVIDVQGGVIDRTPPAVQTYPAAGASEVYQDAVVKAFFSEPVRGLDNRSFTLTDESGALVPAFVDQIGDGTWGLFPHQVFLAGGKTYTAHLAAGICDFHRNCTSHETVWSFKVAATRGQGRGDTSVPLGFGGIGGSGGIRPTPPPLPASPGFPVAAANLSNRRQAP
ncbi:MAG TPA: Ig-like domain-containing protein [Fimbriimonadaceae bacterium]|nr:Ig-like domain-containing protein [Fimbriimonadaceae bacterium]